MPACDHTDCYADWTKTKLRLSLANILLITTLVASAQQKISGRVTGIGNSPLVGASVQLKSSNYGTIADEKGFFEIAAKPGDILVISNVGYLTQEIKLTGNSFLQIALRPSLVNLDEVIVTGYTAQKVREITGSVAVVKPKDLVAVPGGQVEQMLQGRVAGLNVVSSGQPGGGSNIRLHGIGNFGDVTPLYIIDGVEGNINNLNPYDIESLQVLKDASAYAIYGVRGANGVIVVTTKKGNAGKPTVTYNFYLGYQIPLSEGFQYLSPIEEADLVWLRDINSNNLANGYPFDPLYGNGPLPRLPDYLIPDSGYMANDPQVNPDLYNVDYTKGPIHQISKANKEGTDWFHELFKPAFNQNHTITVSGGNEGGRYLFSLGYTNQQGTLLNTYLKRYTVRVNTEFKIKNVIHIGENIQATYRDNALVDNQIPGIYSNTVNNLFNPLVALSLLPVYDIKGNWATLGWPAPAYSNFSDNPVGSRVMSKNNIHNNWEVFGNLYAEADILKHLFVRTSFGGTVDNYYSRIYHSGMLQPPFPEIGPNNSVRESGAFQTSWTWTNTINFSGKISNNQSIKIFAGSEAISNYSREVDASRLGYFTDDPNYMTLSTGTYAPDNSSYAVQSFLFSLIGRLDYSFMDKYFLTGTLRRDGSSVFGADNRYGWFPSVGVAWQAGKEEFLKKYTWIDELKFRISRGSTGYDKNVDPANQYTLYTESAGHSFYDINGTNTRPAAGSYDSRIGVPNTRWQQDIVTNIGIDGILWNGKLSITADLYRKQSSGLLFPLLNDVVLWGEAPAPIVNIGDVLNKGFDLLLGSKGNFGKGFTWEAQLTFDMYRNKIIHLNSYNYFTDNYNLQKVQVRNEVGYPVGQYYGYKITGIFQSDKEVAKSPAQDGAAPGKFKYLDANGDSVINGDDRIYIGNPNPKFTSGLNIGLTYKGFDLSAFFYGSFGNDLLNTVNPHGGSRATLYESWMPLRTNTVIPMAEINDLNDFSEFSVPNSFYVEKGTYVRDKTLMLGYTLPKNLIAKLGINYLRIYVEALNLFTITNYSGFDPEIIGDNATRNESSEAFGSYLNFATAPPSANFGIDFGAYPNGQKQYLIGINVSF
jgi:TonB-linked SusC/RagA family outer membrane protein